MNDLEGKVALITGAGRRRGFGRATALLLAQRGADIALSDLCRPAEGVAGAAIPAWEELCAVAAEIESVGRQALPVRADVTKEAEIQEMVAQTMDRFGRIDILVNNAGVALPMKPVTEIAEWEWTLTFDVICKGTFLCCKHVVPHMIQRGEGGKIVNVSSQAGKIGQAGQAPYGFGSGSL